MRTEYDGIMSMQRFFAGILPAADGWDVRRQFEAGMEPERPFATIEQIGPAEVSGAPAQQELVIPYVASLYLPRTGTRKAADDAALNVMRSAVKVGDPLRPTTDRIPLWDYSDRLEWQRISLGGASAGTFTISLDAETSAALAFDADGDAVQGALDEIVGENNAIVHYRGVGLYDVIFIGALSGQEPGTLEIDDASLTALTEPTVTRKLHGTEAPWRTPSDWMRVRSFGQTTVRDEDEPTLVQVNVDLRCAFSRGLPLPFNQMILQRIAAPA